MRKIIQILPIILSLLLPALAANARTIKGTVMSSSNSEPAIGANCRLLSDGKLLTGTSTDENGYFLLETEVKTALNLEISFVGYASTNIIIESGSKNLNLGKITLEEGVTLDEVTVTANSVIESQGRTIVYPSGADVRASASTLSLFQKLPLDGLEANPINRVISVDGGSPKILINGIPSSMVDVYSIQPKDIEKIEYSRMTPARYMDSGATGFINITLKKRNDGGQIYMWGQSALNTTFVDGNIKASYHQGPSQISLFYNPSWRNYHEVYDNAIESYIGKDFKVDLEEHDRNPFWYHTHQMKLKYDYIPSSKTIFSATFTVTPYYRQSRTIANTIDSQLGEYNNNNLNTSKDFTPSLDLFLHHDFNKSNSIEAQVVGTLSSSDYRRDNRYFFADGSESSYIMNADSRRRSLISEVNYIHSFGENTQLSMGYQNTVSRSTNTYLNSDYKPVLTENNNYIYVRLGQQINKVYLSFSTGAKLFWVNNDVNKRRFVRNISQVQVQYKINRKWNLSAAFKYTPSIPSLSALTDYPQQTTPYLISNGNPDLKVSDIFLYQLTPSFSYKKFRTSLSLQMQDYKNRVINDVSYLGDGLFLSQSVNCKGSKIYYSNLNIKLSDIAGFGLNANMGYKRYECRGEGWSHHLNSFNANFTIWWNKGPYTISYFRKVPGKYLSGHSVKKEENGDAIQFDWQPDKHWTISATWMYMFDKKGSQYPSWNYSSVNPGFNERYIKNNSNMITLAVTYSADFGTIFKTGKRSLNNTDEGKSLLTF